MLLARSVTVRPSKAVQKTACVPAISRVCLSVGRLQQAIRPATTSSIESTAGPHTAAGRRSLVCCSTSRPVATEDDVVRYAAVGDIVSVHFVMRDEDGKVLQASATDLEEPISFEVGAGDMMGNRLFQGFDEAVRGMAVGQTTIMEASGGEWKRELMFVVPRDHPEIVRLEGRYKNHGGLAEGLVVELGNGGMAVILEATETEVKLDANNMLAGKTFTIELELVSIDNVPVTGEAAAAATAATTA